MGNKNNILKPTAKELYYRKQKVTMRYANDEDDVLKLNKRKICMDLIHRSNIGNWDELNRDLIEDKLECAICYNIIFYHESISQRLGPLAF